MKRKRGDIIGDDGELLEHHDEKPKRSAAPSQGGTLDHGRPVTLILTLFVVGIVGIALFSYARLAPEEGNIENTLITTTPNSAPTEIVDLAQVARPTLPPLWTPSPTGPPTETATPSATPTLTATPTNTPQVRERVVTIDAQAGWQSGQTTIEPGEVVEIEYVEGLWESWPGVGMSGPDGRNFHTCRLDDDECTDPLRGFSQAGMIGRVGDNDEMFGIGYKYSFVAETGGELQLRINDDYTTDNSGTITMRVIVKRYND